MWGQVPAMALRNNLHRALATRFGLGQDCHGLKREGGFTLKGGDKTAIEAVLFCVCIHLKPWGQQRSRLLLAGLRKEPYGRYTIHTKTSFVTWVEYILLLRLMRNRTPKWLRFKALDIKLFYELFSTLPAESLIKNVFNWKLKYPPIIVMAFWCFQYRMLRKHMRGSSISYTVIGMCSWSLALMKST